LFVLLLASATSAQTTVRISVGVSGQSNGDSGYASVTPDGRFVLFESIGQNLVPGDTNLVRDVFIRDRREGTTERVSGARPRAS
jgi:hypothetical protein